MIRSRLGLDTSVQARHFVPGYDRCVPTTGQKPSPIEVPRIILVLLSVFVERSDLLTVKKS